MIKLLLLSLLISVNSISAECTKKIKVETTEEKLNLDSIKKNKNIKVYKEVLSISCDLYKDIDVGDVLKSEENERSMQNKGFFFFPELIRKKYKILEK